MTTGSQVSANVRQAVPFFSVADIERSVRCYRDGLGFAMTNRWIVEDRLRLCWLQHGSAALMLQEFPKTDDAWTPAGKVGEGVAIYLICDDALAIYREVTGERIAGRPPLRRQRDVGHDPDRPRWLRDTLREPHGCPGRQ